MDDLCLVRFPGPEDREKVGRDWLYSRKRFGEQMGDGSYVRPVSWAAERGGELLSRGCRIRGARMRLRYVGKKEKLPFVRLGGTTFPIGKWVEVDPAKLIHRDERGNDLIDLMGFEVEISSRRKSAIDDCAPGDKGLITRQWGGLGDQAMVSITLAALLRQRPDLSIHYACPKRYWPLHEDAVAPAADRGALKLVDFDVLTSEWWKVLGSDEWALIGDISHACNEYEASRLREGQRVGLHRADIWAKHLGFEIESHDSYYRVRPEEAAWAGRYLAELLGPERDRPIIGFAPISAGTWRTLPGAVIGPLVGALKEAGFAVLGINQAPLAIDIPTAHGLSLRELSAVLSALDCLVTVATGPYCIAANLRVPTVALFGPIDSAAFATLHPEAVFVGAYGREECPCWGTILSQCVPVFSESRHSGGYVAVRVARESPACLYVEPREVVRAVEERIGDRSRSPMSLRG